MIKTDTTTPLDSLNDWYSLQEAAEKTGRKMDDLIYQASVGNIQIYVIANEWVADKIYEEDTSYEPSIGKGINLPPWPDVNSPDFENQFKEYENQRDSQDIKIGPITFYAKRGQFKIYYDTPTSGPQPVAQTSISKYRNGDDIAEIELDLNRMLKLANQPNPRFFSPKPAVLVKEALDKGKLIVMTDDLLILQGVVSGGSKDESGVLNPQEVSDENDALSVVETVETADNEPMALDTETIARVFDDIYWKYEKWKRNLPESPEWLAPAQQHRGRRGRESSTWKPVELAKLLLKKDSTNKFKLNQAFKNKPELQPWAQEWKDYNSDVDWYSHSNKSGD